MQTTKKPIHKKWWFWFFIAPCLALFFVGVGVAIFTPKETRERWAIERQQKETADSLKDINKEKDKPLKQRIIDAMDAISGDEKRYVYDPDEHPKKAGMSIFVTDFYNDKSLLEDHWKKSIKFANKLFTIEGIDTAVFITKWEMTDDLGNKKRVPVLQSAFIKQKYQQVNWSNLNGMQILGTINEISDLSDSYMHPVFHKRLSQDDINSIRF